MCLNCIRVGNSLVENLFTFAHFYSQGHSLHTAINHCHNAIAAKARCGHSWLQLHCHSAASWTPAILSSRYLSTAGMLCQYSSRSRIMMLNLSPAPVYIKLMFSREFYRLCEAKCAGKICFAASAEYKGFCGVLLLQPFPLPIVGRGAVNLLKCVVRSALPARLCGSRLVSSQLILKALSRQSFSSCGVPDSDFPSQVQ